MLSLAAPKPLCGSAPGPYPGEIQVRFTAVSRRRLSPKPLCLPVPHARPDRSTKLLQKPALPFPPIHPKSGRGGQHRQALRAGQEPPAPAGMAAPWVGPPRHCQGSGKQFMSWGAHSPRGTGAAARPPGSTAAPSSTARPPAGTSCGRARRPPAAPSPGSAGRRVAAEPEEGGEEEEEEGGRQRRRGGRRRERPARPGSAGGGTCGLRMLGARPRSIRVAAIVRVIPGVPF